MGLGAQEFKGLGVQEFGLTGAPKSLSQKFGVGGSRFGALGLEGLRVLGSRAFGVLARSLGISDPLKHEAF